MGYPLFVMSSIVSTGFEKPGLIMKDLIAPPNPEVITKENISQVKTTTLLVTYFSLCTYYERPNITLKVYTYLVAHAFSISIYLVMLSPIKVP